MFFDYYPKDRCLLDCNCSTEIVMINEIVNIEKYFYVLSIINENVCDYSQTKLLKVAKISIHLQ